MDEDEKKMDFNTKNVLSAEQRKLEEQFERENKLRLSRMFKIEFERTERKLEEKENREGREYTVDEMLEESEENVRLWKVRESTCKLCGMVLKSPAHMEQHKDSLPCRKKQAANKGETYTPENQRPVHCEVCDRSVQKRAWNSHVQSRAHRNNVIISQGDPFKCTICNKQNKGQRAKRGSRDHMRCKSHLRKLADPKNRTIHDALYKLYGFKFNTNALIKALSLGS